MRTPLVTPRHDAMHPTHTPNALDSTFNVEKIMNTNKYFHSVLLLATCITVAACGDSYVPKDEDPVVIEEGDNKGTMPTFMSDEIEVGQPSGPLLEGGAAITLPIALKREPTAPVTLMLSSSNESAGTLSPTTLEFTPENWRSTQPLTISPGDDDVASGDTRWSIAFSLQSEDETFHEAMVQDYTLTTIDNDVPPTLITSVMGEPIVTEQGGNTSIAVQLSRQPAGEVLVQVTVSDADEASLDRNALTFDTLTWNLPQQVVVTGKDDMTKDGDATFEVTFGPANSADEAFNGIGPFTVTLTNIDGVCGNTVVDGDEVCEPDGSTGCPAGERTCMVCTTNCELVETDGSSFCGDGQTQEDNGEECDEPERPCDYGEESCQTCRACKWVDGQVTGFCGDGKVQGSAGEACDEPTKPCDYGKMSCMTCAFCELVPGEPIGYCGDGEVQTGEGEECEGPEESCAYGEMSCMTCRACKTVAGQVTGYCGDGAVQTNHGEACDGDPSLNGVTCPRRQEGAICESSCQLDLTACRNDNVVVAAGGLFSCALTSTRGVKCWGDNSNGQLGTGSTGGQQRAAVNVTGLSSGVRQLGAGVYHACALKDDGEVVCWGAGYGNTPQSIIMPGFDIIKLAVGGGHNCVLDGTQSVLCWGNDTYGQLGQGAASNAFSNQVQGLSAGIVNIEAGGGHTCVVYGASRQVECWGANDQGQLGFTSSLPYSRNAQRVSSLSGVEALALGDGHSCALTGFSGVKCWGDNSSNQLGDNSNIDSITPITVSGISSSIAAITAAHSQSCALFESGDLACWGAGYSFSKRIISGISGSIDQISGGYEHTCLAMSSGGVQCFGSNSDGQLGHNSQSSSSNSAVSVANF